MPAASSQKQIPLRHCWLSTLPHSKVQGSGVYNHEPIFQILHHHHQQQQQESRSLPALQVATSLWPQQSSNYWFPNWRELFHGFIVEPSSQPRHATISSIAQNQAATCTRYSPSPSCTQILHSGTKDPTQFAHHGAQSTQHQQITSQLPSSSRHTPLSRFDGVTQLTHLDGEESHAATHSPPYVNQIQERDDHILCPPSGQIPDTIIKYTINSPFWLPQGWVTEMQMRSTGTAADKFYKHLASGRRFRSKNEVFHFIRTGKGRTRKHERRKKSLNLSLMNNFAHKKHTAFAASKLFTSQTLPSSSSENRHSIHVGNSLLMGPRAEARPNGEPGPPSSEQHICFSANSGIQRPEILQLQLKRPAQVRTQKLPIKKKPQTPPLKTGDEDQQTSTLWQWCKQAGAQANAPEMAEQRSETDLSSKDTALQKTAQLGREIQAAHKTVVQMSKEMQATAEKLSREIREAQKDVDLGRNLKLPDVPAEMNSASTNKANAARICRDNQATTKPCTITGNVIQTPQWLPIETSRQTKQLESNSGFLPHSIQKVDNMKGFLEEIGPMLNNSQQATKFVLDASTAERSFSHSNMRHAIQPAIWSDVASHQTTQMNSGSDAAKMLVYTSNHVTQPAETTFVTAVNGTQAARSHVVTATTAGEVTQHALWPGFSALNVAQTTQIGDIAHVKAPEKCGLTGSHLSKCTEIAHFESNHGAQTPQKHVIMSSHHPRQLAPLDCSGTADDAQELRAKMAAGGHLLPATERPVHSIGNADAPLHDTVMAKESGDGVPQHAGDGPFNMWHAALVSVSCGMGSKNHTALVSVSSGMGTNEEVGRQNYQDRKVRSVRRNKFAAVLNPKLDLSRLNPALTARQKAKVVQRMKTRHARDLLATLGLHLCRKALRRKPWLPCTE